MHSKERQGLDGRGKLTLYIYEYLIHMGAPKAAELFLSEIKWDREISIGDPPGFLQSWWAIFWDLYCAAPERRETYSSSNEAKAFYDYGFVGNYPSGPYNSESINFRPTIPNEGVQTGPIPPAFLPNQPPRPPSVVGPARQPYQQAKNMRNPPFQGYPGNQRSILRRPRLAPEYNSNQSNQSFQPMSPNSYTDYNRPGTSGLSLRPTVPFNPGYVPNNRGPPPYSSNVYPGPSGMNTVGGQHHQYQNPGGPPYFTPPRFYVGAPRPQRASFSSHTAPQDLTVTGRDRVYTSMRPVRDGTRPQEFSQSSVYDSTPAEQTKNSTGADCLRINKNSPISDTNSPKDDNSRLNDFTLADYSRFLETDHTDSVAILKIKECMQEEAKKFEKETDPLTFMQLH